MELTSVADAAATLMLDARRPAALDPRTLLVAINDDDLAFDDDTDLDATLAPPLPGHEAPPLPPITRPPRPAAASSPGNDGRYELVGKLGAGGMGEVLAARDRGLRRLVAFKRLLPEAAANKAILGRFLSEAQITSQLDHPNVVPIYGLEVTESGSLAYAMKMIHGVELADIIKRARAAEADGRPVDEHEDLPARLEIFVKVCDAMAFAHDKGVLHRDLKPGNVMVGEHGAVYVVDWGIARLIGPAGATWDKDGGVVLHAGDDDLADITRTRVGDALGTPVYMSPEQAKGDNDALDARSDVFTLGLILAELVTLERARTGGSLGEVLLAALEGRRAPVPHKTKHGRRVPGELAAIVDKATAPARDARYPTVDALADDVRRYLKGDAVLARPDSPLQKAARWLAKHRGAALALLFVLGVVVPAGGVIAGLLAHDARVETLHRREEALTTLVSAVAQRAAHLDAELHAYEGVAANAAGALSALAAVVADEAENGPARRYLAEHVADLVRAEPGTRSVARLRLRSADGRFDFAFPDADADATTPSAAAPAWTTHHEGADLAIRYEAPARLPGGAAAGAVVLDVGPASLRDDLDVPASSAVVESLLLERDGTVAGWVSHGGSAADSARALVTKVLPPLFAGASADWIQLTDEGRDVLVAWHRVDALGWYYVVVADLAILEAKGLDDLSAARSMAAAP
ncbi:MAG: protein kinase [Myxococcales bacterium]|nr:protein kinase [Myxococcales bacterium]